MSTADAQGGWWTYGLLALLVAGTVLLPADLPMVDWPQHAAQVAGLHDLALGRCEYDAIYRVNWLTPYWLGYLPATLLAFVLPVELAMRLVLLAGLLALPLATRLLLRELGRDERWSHASFAAVFGANFDWGFFTFLVAAPFTLLLGWLALRQLRRPSFARAAGLSVVGLLTFAGHAVAAGCGFLLAGVLALLVVPEIGVAAAARRLAPLLVPAGLAAAWLAVLQRWEPATRDALKVGAPVARRLAELPRLLTGLVDSALAIAFVVLLALAFRLAGAAPARTPERWAPLAATLAVYALTPNYLMGTANRYVRMLILLIPCLLIAVAPAAGEGVRGWRRAALPVAVALLLLANGARIAAFAAESAGLDEVLAAAPERERLLYLPLDRDSAQSFAPVYLHSGARYSVGRCGVSGVSFASAFTTALRFRRESEPRLPRGFEWQAARLRWEGVRGQFGLFLVHSREPILPRALFGGDGRVERLAQRGAWSLYRARPVERALASEAAP